LHPACFPGALAFLSDSVSARFAWPVSVAGISSLMRITAIPDRGLNYQTWRPGCI
jgi:hypothetical protein